jgi:hypothetical protein
MQPTRVVHSIIEFEFKLTVCVSSLVFQRPYGFGHPYEVLRIFDIPGNPIRAVVLGWGGVGECQRKSRNLRFCWIQLTSSN